MARWSQEGIPHKGWRYVDVEDVWTKPYSPPSCRFGLSIEVFDKALHGFVELLRHI